MVITKSPTAGHLGIRFRTQSRADIRELDRDEVIDAFRLSGLVWFEGFRVDLDSFREFTKLFTRHFVTEYNPLERHYLGDGTMTVQYYHEGIPLHGEMAYLPRISSRLAPPDILWFYCARPARSGGETLVCDGENVALDLSEATRRIFSEKRIKYRLVTSPEIWRTAAGVSETCQAEEILRFVDGVLGWSFDADGTLRWDYATYAIRSTRFRNRLAFVNSIICIRPPFEDGSEIGTELITEINSSTERLTVPVSWRGGEVIMLDNTRYLHGRTSNDDQRLIYVRMSLANFS
jgi:alpha-ketoglutarate-dependent taurine dioxygenase